MGGARAGPAATALPATAAERCLPPARAWTGTDRLSARTAATLQIRQDPPAPKPTAGRGSLTAHRQTLQRAQLRPAGTLRRPQWSATLSRRARQQHSSNEIVAAGHQFFGTVTQGLARVIEYAFQKQGRPNGYILGQDAGGAFVAGLRYGEGTLYTKDAGSHRVYWQGPSIGWDAGGDGSKVMVLVYNLRDPGDIYRRFGGVDGSAYVVGGVGLTIQKNGDLVTAPIRTGLGLRLGANVGYLKYTRAPTWNPF